MQSLPALGRSHVRSTADFFASPTSIAVPGMQRRYNGWLAGPYHSESHPDFGCLAKAMRKIEAITLAGAALQESPNY